MIERFIEHFTYLGLFVALFAGGLGMPVPEEAAVMAGGVLAHQQLVRWWLALPVCLLGVVGGDCVLYGVGQHWGEQILNWRVVRYVLSPARTKTLRDAYNRHGVKIVFTARHVIGLRAAAFLTAGIAQIGFWKFLAADASAALVTVPLGFGVAYLLTDRLVAVIAGAHRVERWIALLALLAATAWLATWAWRRRRFVE